MSVWQKKALSEASPGRCRHPAHNGRRSLTVRPAECGSACDSAKLAADGSGDATARFRDAAGVGSGRSGGRVLKVDVHTHILPESWPDLKEKFGYGGWVRLDHAGCGPGKAKMFRDDGTPFREVDDSLWSLDRRLKDCDDVGVDVHVLSTVPVMFSYWAKVR